MHIQFLYGTQQTFSKTETNETKVGLSCMREGPQIPSQSVWTSSHDGRVGVWDTAEGFTWQVGAREGSQATRVPQTPETGHPLGCMRIGSQGTLTKTVLIWGSPCFLAIVCAWWPLQHRTMHREKCRSGNQKMWTCH